MFPPHWKEHILITSVLLEFVDGKCHCVKSVMWQFHQLDKNQDHHLDKHEMAVMENNQKEACMRPFLNSCDTDADSRVSKQEWCCCFQAEAPCDLAQKEAREGKLLGATMPRCTVEGYFKRMQCNSSTGFCWCADFNGNEIRGTRMYMKKGEPNCGTFLFNVIFLISITAIWLDVHFCLMWPILITGKFDALGRFKTTVKMNTNWFCRSKTIHC